MVIDRGRTVAVFYFIYLGRPEEKNWIFFRVVPKFCLESDKMSAKFKLRGFRANQKYSASISSPRIQSTHRHITDRRLMIASLFNETVAGFLEFTFVNFSARKTSLNIT